MNYNLIYEKFIDYCKNTSPEERLLKRNVNDLRLNDDYLYTEIHHIIPKSLGGNDNDENLVRLLPEEHLFIHQLRWKLFNKREDMLAVRFILNGLKGIKNNEVKKIMKSKILNKKVLKGYAWMRHHIQSFRKKHSWHTDDGLRRIAEAQKNTIVVKDSKTGKLMGKVPNNHPKVLSREWVHHSLGTKMVYDIIEKKSKRILFEEYYNNIERYKPLIKFKGSQKGFKNGNCKNVSKEEIFEKFNLYINYIESSEDKCVFGIPNFKKWLCENHDICFKGNPFKKFRFPDIPDEKKRSEIIKYLVGKTIGENKIEYYLKLNKCKSRAQVQKLREKLRSKNDNNRRIDR